VCLKVNGLVELAHVEVRKPSLFNLVLFKCLSPREGVTWGKELSSGETIPREGWQRIPELGFGYPVLPSLSARLCRYLMEI
jgi:hypothetical protein